MAVTEWAFRGRIETALKSISGMSSVRLMDAESVEHAVQLAKDHRAPCVAVVWRQEDKGEAELGTRAPLSYVSRWALVAVVPTLQHVPATLRVDEIADKLLALRGLNIGDPANQGNSEVYLEHTGTNTGAAERLPSFDEAVRVMEFVTTQYQR